jgi:hypothetical protein
MTPHDGDHTVTSQTAEPGERSRVSFRQPVNDEGFLDAGWWPRSRDLTVELPPLLDLLWTSFRDVTRVSYAVDFWNATPHHLRIQGKVVRLGGFHTQMPMLLSLIDTRGLDRIDMLVIRPETDPAVAERALTLACGDPSPDHPEQILNRARDQIAHELLQLQLETAESTTAAAGLQKGTATAW